MLIAISGSQGCGKTTVLNEIEKRGFNVIKRKTARSVLEDFSVKTLDEIYANPELLMKWQELIYQRKVEDEKEAIESEELWFTERSFADLFSYAVMAIGKNNAYSTWVNKYYDMCNMQNFEYLHAFYIHGGYFTPENDGVRGVNQHYSTMIDVSMYMFTKQMFRVDEKEGYYYRFSDIEVSDLSERTRTIMTVSLNKFLEERRD
jgi:hypothetical protein